MAVDKKKTKKKKYLNSENAQEVANRGLNPAYTQAHGQLYKGEDGEWHEGQPYTRTRSGRMSTDGKRAGGKTWTMTPKNDDGSPVIGKNGKVRQSGRSTMATRRQREYDIKVGLNNGWRDENGLWHGGAAPAGAATIASITTG